MFELDRNYIKSSKKEFAWRHFENYCMREAGLETTISISYRTLVEV